MNTPQPKGNSTQTYLQKYRFSNTFSISSFVNHICFEVHKLVYILIPPYNSAILLRCHHETRGGGLFALNTPVCYLLVH